MGEGKDDLHYCSQFVAEASSRLDVPAINMSAQGRRAAQGAGKGAKKERRKEVEERMVIQSWPTSSSEVAWPPRIGRQSSVRSAGAKVVKGYPRRRVRVVAR